MVRMLTADYCGIGESFTHNGVPLAFDAFHWGGFAHYEPHAGEPLEAIWSDRGAVCIGSPRLAAEHPYPEIISRCKSSPPPPCTATLPDRSLLTGRPTPPSTGCDDASGSYLVSGNPPPSR
jgi:hypothetical protein